MATATTAPKAPVGNAKPEPVATEAKPKKEKAIYQQEFASEKEMVETVQKRDKGPRRMFKIDFSGKTYWVAANNAERAPAVAFRKLGGTCTELGKKASTKSSKISAEALLASLDFQSTDELARIQEQLAKLVALRKQA